jgi:hypothetical protein
MWDSYLDLKAFSRAFNLGRRAGRIHTQKGKSRNGNEKEKGAAFRITALRVRDTTQVR